MSALYDVNDTNFSSVVLESSLPVLVDFSAAWCGPCSRQHPILQKFADKHSDKIKVCKVDIDESPNITAQHFIRSVPTIIFFKDGKSVITKSGLMSLETLETHLNKILE